MGADRNEEHAASATGAEILPLTTSLWALIKEDFEAHDRDWTRPGFRALAIHRFGVRRMQVRPKLLRAPVSVLYRWGYRYARNRYGIELPYSAHIGRRVVFEHQSGIVLHGNAVVGDDCTIRHGVTIGNRSGARTRPAREDQLTAPRLGNRVNVGVGATILGDITIGDDVRIGANAVVLDNVPASSTVVGPKAVILPPRSTEPSSDDPRATERATIS